MKNTLIYVALICLLASQINTKLLHRHNHDDEKEEEKTITVAIIGTNDIHGTAFPREILNTATGQTYKYGGLVYMARLIEIIQKEFKNRVIYLDGGDQFQGGIQSGPKVSSGEIMADFYNTLGLAGSSIGNHEFDFGPEFLFNYLETKESPALAANVKSETGEENFLPRQKPTELIDLGDVKIGVIGLSTLETPTATSGFIDHIFPEYKFLDYTDIVIQRSKELREQGANAVLVVSHVGNQCPQNSTYDVRTNETEQADCNSDQITKLIDSIPEGTIDGVVEGHRHLWVHHWYKNVPIMGVINGGYHFNILYLNFDPETKEVVSNAIEGPVPVCEKLFSNTHDCSYKNPEALETAGDLTEWTFHHQDVYAQEELSQIFAEKWEPKMEQYFQKIFETEIYLNRVRNQENPLGNLVTSVLMRVAEDHGIKADFSIINHGAFRSTWYPGVVQYQHFYGMFPFSNQIVTFELSGADLLEMLKRVQNGWDGFYYTDGIFQTVSLTEVVNEDGSKVVQKGFVNAKLLDGTEIDPQKTYTGCTVKFLLNGGDDFIKAFGNTDLIDPQTGNSFVPLVAKNIQDVGEQREEFMKQLKAIGVVTAEDWALDPENPRMVVVKQ